MDTARARALLGVTPGAAPDTVEAAFRARAWASHPDRGGSAAHFAELSEARRLLTVQSSRPNSRPNSRPAAHAGAHNDRPDAPQWITTAASTAASVAADLEVIGAMVGRGVRRWLARRLEI